LSSDSIIRYLTLNDTAVLQLAYKYDGQFYILDKRVRKILPTTIEAGSFDTIFSSNNQWPASPLIINPVSVSEGSVRLGGYSYAVKGLGLIPGQEYKVNGIDSLSYSFGVTIRTYYSLSGNGVENKKPVRFLGSIVITRNYFKDVGLVDQKTITNIQRIFADGKIAITKRYSNVARPYKAKIFTDFNERFISVISPNGAEIWQSGKSRKIVWSSIGYLPYVKIQFLANSNNNWQLVEDSVANTGNYNWLVPLVKSDSCRIKISEPTGNYADISDSLFAIY
jgi:hypothetical protein